MEAFCDPQGEDEALPLLWHLGEVAALGQRVAIQSLNFRINGREIVQMKELECEICKWCIH